MQLPDLLKFMHENPLGFESILGITADEYASIQRAFNKTKDSTKKIPEALKLLAALLIHRFELSETSIKNIIFAIAKEPVTSKNIRSFKERVAERLSTALKNLPNLAAKLNPAFQPLQASTHRDRTYSNLDVLLEAINESFNDTDIITYKGRTIDNAWAETYLNKPATLKTKTGQSSFLQVIDCLSYDLDTFADKDDYLAWYLAIAFNFNAHNSSYAARNGHGKVQKREADHPLYYARSQNKHIFGLLFKLFTATVSRSAQCMMPRNEPLYKIISTEFNNKFTRILSDYNQHGYSKPAAAGAVKVKKSFFALQFSACGLRKNALQVTIVGVQHALTSKTAPAVIQTSQELLLIPNVSPKPILKLSPARLKRHTQQVHHLMNAVKVQMDQRAYYPNLYTALTRYRRANAASITRDALFAKFKNIKVVYDDNTNTLDISFYPDKKIEDSANYTLGVTNVIINYFTGMLNYFLKINGIDVIAQRRQSFGFNRVTVTDTTSMTMRVSLGFEPASFNTVFLSALHTLDASLSEFNFLNKSDPKLARGFEEVEKERKAGKVAKAKKSPKTGIRFYNVMRSGKNQLKAIQVAEAAFVSTATSANHHSAAFSAYINELTKDGFKASSVKPYQIPENVNNDTLSPADNIVVVGLLNNVLKYTTDTTAAMRRIADDTAFKHSYTYHLSKLTKLSFKSLAWLTHHTKYKASHVNAKVLLLIDDMLEHLIALHTLVLQHDKPNINSVDHVIKLAETERSFVERALKPTAASIDVFFCDSGQQSLTVSLLAMSMQLVGKKGSEAALSKIYTYGKCYYELSNNLKDNLEIKVCQSAADAAIVFVDIREIELFNNTYLTLANAKAVIIDCTHNPCLNDNGMKEVVDNLLKKGVYVVIANSMLKHEQLGLDKFQNGKMVVLTPPNTQLRPNVRDELQSISNTSMHPIAARFFTMINDICRDKYEAHAERVVPISLFNPAKNEVVKAKAKIGLNGSHKSDSHQAKL